MQMSHRQGTCKCCAYVHAEGVTVQPGQGKRYVCVA